MRIEAIAIGTELLTTSRVDTNSVWIAQRLADLGLAFHRKSAVGDDREELRGLFHEALNRSDLIICTGGLGPTFDDFTKELWAEVLGAPLVEEAAIREAIEAFFRSRNRPCPANNFKQALIPVGAEALDNPIGSAPGIFWEKLPTYPGIRLVLLPGVPGEMKRMWLDQVEPRLRASGGHPTHTLRMLVGSVGESALEQRTTPLREAHGALDWSILASLGTVELVARSSDPVALEAAQRDFEEALGADRICTGAGSLEQTVLERLKVRGETLALAESMSGGRVSALLTAVPGASEAFLGGAVVYSPRAKGELVGLTEAFLAEHGTVSEATTRALAEGIRTRLQADWGLAITGNAGPTEDKDGPAPVGTFYMAVAGPRATEVRALHFPGERSDVQARAAVYALDFLRRCLL
jgi:nicotinamide-nucleotide amidase